MADQIWIVNINCNVTLQIQPFSRKQLLQSQTFAKQPTAANCSFEKPTQEYSTCESVSRPYQETPDSTEDGAKQVLICYQQPFERLQLT